MRLGPPSCRGGGPGSGCEGWWSVADGEALVVVGLLDLVEEALFSYSYRQVACSAE
jgi:hypothetical protein